VSELAYLNLDLLIERAEPGYRVRYGLSNRPQAPPEHSMQADVRSFAWSEPGRQRVVAWAQTELALDPVVGTSAAGCQDQVISTRMFGYTGSRRRFQLSGIKTNLSAAYISSRRPLYFILKRVPWIATADTGGAKLRSSSE
jgi:hypothetical protein